MTLKTIFLFMLVLFMPALLAGAEEPVDEPKEELKILFEFAPDSVVHGELFLLSIVVNRENPDEILVEPPDFNGAFRIEQLRTEARIVRDDARGGDRWTVFEFMLTALESGARELGAFTVSSSEETALTNPISVNVREAKQDSRTALAWFGLDGFLPPGRLSVGSPREAVLRITAWPENMPYPAASLPLRIEPPQNAIVEYIPLTENERRRGIVSHLRITAIEGRLVETTSRFLRYENLSLEIPALRIAVRPAASAASSAVRPAPDEPETAAPGTSQPVKPVSFSGAIDTTKKIFPVFRRGPETCLAVAENLWAREMFAEALAVLRHGERALTAAYAVKEMRKTCEDALGLPVCPDEKHLPVMLLFLVSALFALTAVMFFFTRKNTGIPAFCIALAAVVSLLALSLPVFSYLDGQKQAVLKRCAAYPVPEDTYKSQAFFMEGEPARIRSVSASWLYAESAAAAAAGKSGWIKKDNAVRQFQY
ncbi:MAG: BatD family protein [Spirochaetaceae bacterium]|jgi:hypothetical protein|nr:BatD family protein [Spirochaetaceae bacterium]